ncbi:GGDEF domain-containing protein [Butyrivibrio sp. XPD2006]|uniref:GGDEF domain-containing protein n=1 Tax=Butyrivibrio sp. XPD2006 TaxID=1280668 RepID=UPI0003B7A1F6|nr:GGDEF domain-containing protein [Butyrivibrio sp. XPD2006]
MKIHDYGQDVVLLNKEMLSERAKMSTGFIGACNKLLKRAKEIDDTNLLGYSYYYLADAYYLISTDYRKFNTNLLKAIEYLQSCGDNEHLARCYNLLGIDALNHGNPELALDFFLSGLGYCENIDKNSSIPGFLKFNIGQIYYDNGEIKQSLGYIRSAYRDIRKNKKESLYFRNLLYCYCFQADCYIILDKKESVEKCLQGIEQLEQAEGVNLELFRDLPVLDIKMRGYYYLGEMDLYEKYADMLSYQLQNNKFALDSMEDIYVVCRFFMKVGRYGEVKRIIKNAERSLNDLNIPNLVKGHAKLRIEFYDKMGETKEKNQALLDYYNASLEQEKESIANYKFFMNIRNRLSSIEKENIMLIKQAETDPLTGLGNRYGLNKYADKAFEDAYEGRYSLAVEILDVDNFKIYNDTYGHQLGDLCLKKISEVIANLCNVRQSVHAFRYGGDEFVLVYENMSDEEIMECATSLRDQVASLKFDNRRFPSGPVVTISQGIRNSVPSETNKLWDYMYAADNALYDVKEHKKGEVVLLHQAIISQKSLDEAKHS